MLQQDFHLVLVQREKKKFTNEVVAKVTETEEKCERTT